MNKINNVEYQSVKNVVRTDDSYQYINNSTLMKKVDGAPQEADASMRPCPDFADIVSIISQQDQSKNTESLSIAEQKKQQSQNTNYTSKTCGNNSYKSQSQVKIEVQKVHKITYGGITTRGEATMPLNLTKSTQNSGMTTSRNHVVQKPQSISNGQKSARNENHGAGSQSYRYQTSKQVSGGFSSVLRERAIATNNYSSDVKICSPSVKIQSSSKTQSSRQKKPILNQQSSKVTLDHSYFQALLMQHQHQTPKAFSPNQNSQQVFSPSMKHSLNNTALMELKAKQQKLLQEHKNKMRKDTLDKTIETINQMKVSSQQASGRKSATYTSKKNSIQTMPRTKSSTGVMPKKPQMTPIASQRMSKNVSKSNLKRDSTSTSRSRLDLQKPKESHIFNDYKHFIEKQKKIVAQLSQTKLSDSHSMLETISELKRPQPIKNTPKAVEKSFSIPNLQISSSRRKSSGQVTHRKDFIQENKKIAHPNILNTSRIGGKTPQKQREESKKNSAFGYYNNHNYYLNTNTSAQKRKTLNATQTFQSTKIGIKPTKSKSVLQKPKFETKSEINDTVLQEKNINNNNTTVDLLFAGQKPLSSKKPSEQSRDQLVLSQPLQLQKPQMYSDVQNILINSKQKSTPGERSSTARVLLSSSQIRKQEQENHQQETKQPKPFSAESKKVSPKKQDKENNAKLLKEFSPQPQPLQEVQNTAVPQPTVNPSADDTMIFSDKNSLDDYIIGKQIGQGAYAVVRIGLHKPTNQKVAMKIYKKYKLEEPNRRKSVKREIKLMEKMKHVNIIQLYEIIDTEKYVILVMEYIGGGSLHGYLKSKSNRRLEEYDAKRIFREILEGLKYCHSRCITHRDIKLENLLLDDNGVMKMIDFGFSTCVPNDKKIKIFCGTPSYMAPEIVLKTEYCGPPADIWALGVLLFTCLSGQFPYRGATDEELYDKICRADYNLPSSVKDSLSMEAIDLLSLLFRIKADDRPSARELLNHPWFASEISLQKRAKSQKEVKQYQTRQDPPVPLKINTPSHVEQPRSSSHVIGKQSHTQKYESRKQIVFGDEQIINNKIVQIIVDKLGYTTEEVMSYLQNPKEQNSFVSNLYQRLLDEEMEKEKTPVKNMQNVVSQGSLGMSQFGGAQSQGFGHLNPQQNCGVQPSYVPSMKSLGSSGSYMGCLSNNIQKSAFNNTQPLNKTDSSTPTSKDLMLGKIFSSSSRSGVSSRPHYPAQAATTPQNRGALFNNFFTNNTTQQKTSNESPDFNKQGYGQDQQIFDFYRQNQNKISNRMQRV